MPRIMLLPSGHFLWRGEIELLSYMTCMYVYDLTVLVTSNFFLHTSTDSSTTFTHCNTYNAVTPLCLQ